MATKYEIKLSDATEAGVFTVKSAGTAAWKKTAGLANKDYTSIVTVDGDAKNGWTITGEDDKSVSIGGASATNVAVAVAAITTGSKDDYIDASNLTFADKSAKSISTGAGNDSVMGVAAEGITIETGDGNDVISVGGAKATIDAGAGNDSIAVGGDNAQITLGDGKDTISIGAKNVNITDFDWANDTIQLANDLVAASLTTDGGWGNSAATGTVEAADAGFYAISANVGGETKNYAWAGTDGTTIDVSGSKSKVGFQIYSNINDEAGDSVIGSRQNDSIVAGSNDTIDGGRGDDSISIAKGATAVTYKLYDGGDSDTVQGFTAGFDSEDDVIYVDTADAIKKASIDNTNDLIIATGKAKVNLAGVATGTDSLNVKVNVAGENANVQFFESGKNDSLNGDANYVWSMTDDGTLKLVADSTDYTIDLGNSTNYGDTRMYHNVSNVDAFASNGNVVLVSGSKAATLKGSTGSSTLIGAGSKGDVLYGGMGNDVYEYAAGYGKDTIDNYSYENTASSKNGEDTIHFASAASSFTSNGKNITLTFNSDSSQTLTVKDRGANDAIRFTVGDDTVATVAKVGNATAANKFTFSDDVTLYAGGSKVDTVTVGTDTYDKKNIWLDNSGTDGSAQYYGIEVVDASATTADVVIAGSSANETLKASKGKSDLNGGAGNDVLYGNKSGDTTFWFGAKGGKDTIMSSNTTDKVLLYDYDTTDINASACTYGTNLTLAFNDGSTLTVKNVSAGAQQFTLKDGSVWTYDTKTKTFSTNA